MNTGTVTPLHNDTIEKQEEPVTYYAYAKTVAKAGEKDSAWTSAIAVEVPGLDAAGDGSWDFTYKGKNVLENLANGNIEVDIKKYEME